LLEFPSVGGFVARKRENKFKAPAAKGLIKNAGEQINNGIISVIEKNYMPYAMSVIMSRAIPEIDGFKPSQRKVLYTMYKMGLLGGMRTKSANIVGQTMRLNPHGDVAIYDTMARMSRGYEALPYPYIDSKGNFGKFYSRDMARAAPRYTEAKLNMFAGEIFEDIEKDTVDFFPNYDNTMKEPSLLPVRYPAILVNSCSGIAVGMASSICPFNLRELCETTVMLIKNPDHKISDSMPAPDFPGGCKIIGEKKKIEEIYASGRGNIRLRAVYAFDKKQGCIDITNIPYCTNTETIIEKTAELIKCGKITEVSDIRDETGIDGLKITIDLKRGADAEKLMLKLFKMTSLEDTFSCNFNVLINGTPRVVGVKELIFEWLGFRIRCVKRRISFDLNCKREKLHLLSGLEKILFDIDKVVTVIRGTDEESHVIPNLMNAFYIDSVQAEFIAEIKLRNLNKEYILKKISETKKLKAEIAEFEKILGDENKIKEIIIEELKNIAKKYGKPRECPIIDEEAVEKYEQRSEEISDYAVTYFFTRDGYFKKITPQSLRNGGEHKLKNGDEITFVVEGKNSSDILFFTNKAQVYKTRGNFFEDTKISSMGDFVAAKLGGEPGEEFKFVAITNDYSGFMVFFFEDGKVAKITMESYLTKTNRKKLIKAYNGKSSLIACFYIEKDGIFFLESSSGRFLVLNSSLISAKTSKDSQGVAVFRQLSGHKVISVRICQKDEECLRYGVRNIPSSRQKIGGKKEVFGDQLKLFKENKYGIVGN
jgi:DNA gyrase subunit A